MMNEQIYLAGVPVVGFGEAVVSTPARVPSSESPWAMALATSAFGAATTWVLDEIVRRGRR